ncbi:helix-turn-helix transcriptional regulator, partial [Patescibacteria group bacterium]|nr:helix-turn-helix transcriptional regulator [Patescibacteria group bacterium]
MNKKIKEALKNGDLIDFDELFKSYSKKHQAEINKRVRYLKMAMALRNLRRQLKISQAKLAKKMQVKREYIARAESGQQNVTLETLYRI